MERKFQARTGKLRTGAVAVCNDGAVLQLYVLDQPADLALVSFAEAARAMIIDGGNRNSSPVTVSSIGARPPTSAAEPVQQISEAAGSAANADESTDVPDSREYVADEGKVVNVSAARAAALLGVSSKQDLHAQHCRTALKVIHDLMQPRSSME